MFILRWFTITKLVGVLAIVTMLEPRISFSVERSIGQEKTRNSEQLEQIAGNFVECTKIKFRMVKQDRALKKLDKEIRKLYEKKSWIEMSDTTYVTKGDSYNHRVVVSEIRSMIGEIHAYRAGAAGLMQEYREFDC